MNYLYLIFEHSTFSLSSTTSLIWQHIPSNSLPSYGSIDLSPCLRHPCPPLRALPFITNTTLNFSLTQNQKKILIEKKKKKKLETEVKHRSYLLIYTLNEMTTSYMHLVRPNVSAPAASSAASSCNVKIHTSALFQILEILSKQVLSNNSSGTSSKRIIGTLLGLRSDDGSEFEVRDAFMVTCTETGDSIAIDEQTHKQMYQLYKKAHPKESVLGWFGSSNQVDSTTALIHDFYSKGSDRSFPYPAIYLNVDYQSEQDLKLPELTTYIGAAIAGQNNGPTRIGWKLINQTSSYVFTPIPNQVITKSITEKLALNKLNEIGPAQNELLLSSSDSSKQLNHLTLQLQAVGLTIESLLNYIKEHKNGNDDDSIDLLRLLSNNLLNRPQRLSNLEELESKFKAYNQDVIMIEYLTKAVKEQIELSARLTAEADKK